MNANSIQPQATGKNSERANLGRNGGYLPNLLRENQTETSEATRKGKEVIGAKVDHSQHETIHRTNSSKTYANPEAGVKND